MGSGDSEVDRSFSGNRKAAWEGLLHCQARVLKRLDQDLEEAGKVPLNTYDILVQLAEHGGRLRLRDLVERVVLSQPGLSRKVARLEDEGLVERERDPTDGRGILVRLTRAGRAALRTASVVHISGVEREFTSRISDEEAATLSRVFARLLTSDPTSDTS
jgi:DNA-binding MarR family transcriptional regulator